MPIVCITCKTCVAAMPPVNMPADMEHVNVNNGHHAIYSPHPIILGQEILIPTNGDRFYPRYNARLPEDHHGPVQYRTFVPQPPPQNNVHMYPQPEPPQPPRDDLFTPGMPTELMPEYRVNANTYGPRPDAVWAPNPGEMFNFGDMRAALPSAPPLAPEVYTPARSSVILPLVRSRRSSPVDGAGPRAVGGPVSGPGPIPCPAPPEPFAAPAPVPTVSNGPTASQTVAASRLAVGANRLPRDRSTVADRLSAAAKAYQATGSDDYFKRESLLDLSLKAPDLLWSGIRKALLRVTRGLRLLLQLCQNGRSLISARGTELYNLHSSVPYDS
uniref:SFRICE_006729 n=1 Tax=Spodoptera frugiperda TaxID=7108 RepID=A0A2H1VLW3_SPOFR